MPYAALLAELKRRVQAGQHCCELAAQLQQTQLSGSTVAPTPRPGGAAGAAGVEKKMMSQLADLHTRLLHYARVFWHAQQGRHAGWYDLADQQDCPCSLQLVSEAAWAAGEAGLERRRQRQQQRRQQRQQRQQQAQQQEQLVQQQQAQQQEQLGQQLAQQQAQGGAQGAGNEAEAEEEAMDIDSEHEAADGEAAEEGGAAAAAAAQAPPAGAAAAKWHLGPAVWGRSVVQSGTGGIDVWDPCLDGLSNMNTASPRRLRCTAIQPQFSSPPGGQPWQQRGGLCRSRQGQGGCGPWNDTRRCDGWPSSARRCSAAWMALPRGRR
ncbi:hypothetical protein ABPG75_002816 [Micractinium tetrahymenae]